MIEFYYKNIEETLKMLHGLTIKKEIDYFFEENSRSEWKKKVERIIQEYLCLKISNIINELNH